MNTGDFYCIIHIKGRQTLKETFAFAFVVQIYLKSQVCSIVGLQFVMLVLYITFSNILFKGIKKIDNKYYSNYVDESFGIQTIQSLQLCSMLAPKDKNGYYQVVFSVPLGK